MKNDNKHIDEIPAHDVFISYAYSDFKDEHGNEREGNVISQIMRVFDAAGVSYWIDNHELKGGMEYGKEIAEQIQHAKVFLFISSKASNASRWAANEVATASIYGKTIIPIRVDNTPYSTSVIFYLAALQYITYNGDPNALNQIIEIVNNKKCA